MSVDYNIIAAVIAGFVALSVALITRMSKLHEYKLESFNELKRKVVSLNAKVEKISSIRESHLTINSFDEWYDPEEMGVVDKNDLRQSYREIFDGDFDGAGLRKLSDEAWLLSQEVLLEMNFFNHFLKKRYYLYKRYKKDVSSFFAPESNRDNRDLSKRMAEKSFKICSEIDKELRTITAFELCLVAGVVGAILYVVYNLTGSS